MRQICVCYELACSLRLASGSMQEELGHTCVLVAVCGVAVAAMAVSDPLKPEAPAVVAALQSQVGVENLFLLNLPLKA